MNYDNSNRGVLFRNDRKESEKHPDYKGNINVGGQEFWLSAWLQKSKDGKPYMSLAVKPKEPKAETPKQEPPADFDDEIPF